MKTVQNLNDLSNEKSSSLLQNIFLDAPAAICILEGSEHKYILANKAYEQLTNRQAKDLYGKSNREVFPELIGTGTFELFDKVFETGEPFAAPEYAAMLDLNNNGVLRQHYFNFSMVPLKNNSGEIYAVMAMTFDITEQVEAKKTITNAVEKLMFNDTIFTSIPDAIITSDVTGKVTSWNKCAEELYGFSKQEMMGQIMPDMVPTEFINKEIQNWKEIFAKKGNWKGEVIQTCKGGNKIYVSVAAHVINNNHGEIIGHVSVNRDITSQKEAEYKIKESEHRYHEIIYTSPSLIAIFKGEDMIIDIANDAMLDSWGKGNVIGRSIFDVMPESVEQGFDKLLLSVYKTGESILGNEVPVRLFRKGTKELVYYNFVYQAQRNVHGEIEGVATIATEVTSQVEFYKKIKESEKQFRNVLLQSPSIFVILKGPEMVIDFVNEPLLRSWGRTNDIVGKTILEALPEIKDQAFLRLLEEVYKTGETYFGKDEKAVIIKNGEPEDVYYNYVYQAFNGEDGKFSGITIMATDISEQVVARKKIEESEKQQAFLLALTDAIRPLSNPADIEGATTQIALDFMRADWCHYITIEEDNLIIQRGASRDGFPSLAGVYPISSFALFKAVLNTGIPSIIDDVHTTDILDVELKQLCIQLQNIAFVIVPIIKNGKPVGLFVIVQSKPRKWTDLEVQLTIETAERIWEAVERSKAEEALRKSEEKYRTLFTSIDQGFVFCELVRNKEGKGIDYYMLELNPTYERQTGLSTEMVLGKTILQVFPSMDKGHIDIFAAVVDNHCPVVFDQYFEVNHRWHEVKVYPGQKDRFTVLFSDITERKQAEEKIKESEAQLRELSTVLEQKVLQRTTQLEEKNKELQTMNAELDAFTYVSSHDLQEPLRKIQTIAGRIIEKEHQNLSDNGKNYFRLMHNAAQRMQTLIQDLLAFSKLSIADRKFETTDLHIIIEEIKNEFKDAIAEKNAVITVEGICDVKIIPFQFRQLMHNLISNAFKFSNPKIPLQITISSRIIKQSKPGNVNFPVDKEYCHITIADNGIGFEKEFSEKIFEVFQRLHDNDEYAGTGIGLAIVKKIVENHNGIIRATSEIQKGTTFDIYIPA